MTNNNTFTLEIVASDGKFLSLEVDSLYVEIENLGVEGILKDHLPLVAKLGISIFYVYQNNKKREFAISGGILDVKKEKTIIIANTFEEDVEIDFIKAQKQKEEYENQLQSLKKDDVSYELVEFSLKKTLNRLKLKM